jgi:hypothetical protein
MNRTCGLKDMLGGGGGGGIYEKKVSCFQEDNGRNCKEFDI